jgi:hypothetical protein
MNCEPPRSTWRFSFVPAIPLADALNPKLFLPLRVTIGKWFLPTAIPRIIEGDRCHAQNREIVVRSAVVRFRRCIGTGFELIRSVVRFHHPEASPDAG